MDVGVHQVAHSLENRLVSPESTHPDKRCGYDDDPKVPLATLGAGMTLVQMTLVQYVQIFGVETFLQDGADGADPVRVHGSTLRNGLTVTLW